MIPDATYNDYWPAVNRELVNLAHPRERIFVCSGCGIEKRVRALRLNNHWHYRSKCPECGTLSSTIVRLSTKCPECGAYNTVNHKNPLGGCGCNSRF